ncbi:DUF423 domain-containing protein [Catalinimonas niigatensis]|uniref:DUF423 domain-containing protein n=1 Tax=Catalinimonas niigatensis TaxID=1397264 RepID=UPI002666B580|nr:DUF423 domain-containing protein [Catalinimonas niigatensis]WPP53133.1 DUF423 domain-containing protein [Catalinimonas niigatensis]
MQKIILLSASAFGALSVMIGAFGAHALRATLEANGRLDTFETAVKYQFYHTLALLAIGLLMYRVSDKLLEYASLSMIGGILIFSGSLYLLCMTGIRWLGAITPIGGLLMIIGWILLFWAIARGS